MYGQRGIPVVLEFCKDIREVAAEGCIMLNYANPNAMITCPSRKYVWQKIEKKKRLPAV